MITKDNLINAVRQSSDGISKQVYSVTRSILERNGLHGAKLEEVLNTCVNTYGNEAPTYAREIREEDFS